MDALARTLGGRGPTLVLSGAGCSTDCGIPDYRDETGQWKRSPPVNLAEFLRDPGARRRYWARSMAGWPTFEAACPGRAHRAIAALECDGTVGHVITQNVDGLHRRAGTRRLTELHGNLSSAVCLDCGEREDRRRLQRRLRAENAHWRHAGVTAAPDGDADLHAADYDAFVVPGCRRCGGVLKPDVVFFGENVPRPRVEGAFARLAEAGALLVVGSSLMVFSGYRFVREANRLAIPVALVNRGRTRADDDACVKVDGDCGSVLELLRRMLAGASIA